MLSILLLFTQCQIDTEASWEGDIGILDIPISPSQADSYSVRFRRMINLSDNLFRAEGELVGDIPLEFGIALYRVAD